jgi:hypothetical protein
MQNYVHGKDGTKVVGARGDRMCFFTQLSIVTFSITPSGKGWLPLRQRLTFRRNLLYMVRCAEKTGKCFAAAANVVVVEPHM